MQILTSAVELEEEFLFCLIQVLLGDQELKNSAEWKMMSVFFMSFDKELINREVCSVIHQASMEYKVKSQFGTGNILAAWQSPRKENGQCWRS